MRRGYVPDDDRDFRGAGFEKLRAAVMDLTYLLNRGYPQKSASTFVGNHYLLSERQRLAICRVTASNAALAARRQKELPAGTLAGRRVDIDGFNSIITLEVALSGSPVLRCADGTYRDLAGLRGTYRIIDKTEPAVDLLLFELLRLGVGQSVIWLDAPVSNSGRLKTLLAERAEALNAEVDVEVVPDVDRRLCERSCVVTGDSIILDRCESWTNVLAGILPALPRLWEIVL